MRCKNLNTEYFKNLVFGAEDSLVSTVGVLYGIASTGYGENGVILTGLVVIAVEALSMGVGSFLTTTSAQEVDFHEKRKGNPVVGGLFMFFSYLLSGFIPLAPYLVFGENARYISVIITICALFLLGFLPTRRLKSAFRMAVLAGLAVLAGYLIGQFAENLINFV